MAITTEQIKELREATGAGILDCRKALVNADGDFEKALKFLREKGLATAAKRSDREASEGMVELYSHGNGRVGVMVEVNCETDFVAKTDDFRELSRNIAMHIAATNPVGISPEDVPEEILNKEKEIYRAQALQMGKPEKMIDKIVEGKLQKFFKESCLLNQAYVRNPDITVTDLLNESIAKIGENITIKRFVRFQVGES